MTRGQRVGRQAERERHNQYNVTELHPSSTEKTARTTKQTRHRTTAPVHTKPTVTGHVLEEYNTTSVLLRRDQQNTSQFQVVSNFRTYIHTSTSVSYDRASNKHAPTSITDGHVCWARIDASKKLHEKKKMSHANKAQKK